MISGTINKPDGKEFAKVWMAWLKSKEPTLTIKENQEDKSLYFRIPLNGLEYIYSTSTNWMKNNNSEFNPIYSPFKFNAIYSPEKGICVFHNFAKNYASRNTEEKIAQEESMGFYERERTVRKFNEFFKQVFPPIFFTKYKDKVTSYENKDTLDYYTDNARAAYLRGEQEVSLLDEFYKQLKSTDIYDHAFQGICKTNTRNDYYRILIDFIMKGETEDAVKEFVEKALNACEKKTPNALTKMHHTILMYLKSAKMIQKLTKTYIPTEGERLTKSMCQAYNAFFKDKEPPKKIKITVMGTNKKRSWRYEKNNIDIEGKIMTMKVSPVQLAFPCQAFHLYCYSSISDFTSTNLPVIKDYNRPIEIPFNDITAEDILKIEYGRNIIWERPENL